MAIAAKDFEGAVATYTEGIECYPTAVLFCNRAMAQLKLENWGSVIADCTSCLELDPSNPKVLLGRRLIANDI